MKAKFVYENMEFKRGQDPKRSMGIGKRALIKKWFDDLDVGSEEYSIDDNFNIFFKRSLDLRNTQITSLPDNLSIRGDLYLTNTLITSLPNNLSVRGFLDLTNTPITFLPDNLSVGGSLDLRNTPITSFPDNLAVSGNIYKDF